MYPFAALDDEHFRILDILPAVDMGAEIRCELHHREYKPGTYHALSYVWGSPMPHKSIYIDDQPVEVTPNLFMALRRIRHTTDKVCLWVDALCINQKDDLEKTSQVKRMTEIYAKATTVFMWLGEEEDDSDLAMALLQRLENDFVAMFDWEPHRDRTSVFGPFATTPFQSHSSNNSPGDFKEDWSDFLEAFRSERFDRHWRALECLFKRPFWFRVWIVQEIVATFRATLRCGSQAASWNFLMMVTPIFRALRVHHREVTLGARLQVELVVKQYAELNFNIRHDEKPSLLEALVRLRRFQATDPRDHIYAILNLVNQKGFEPDYTKSMAEVYKDVVKFVIEQDQTLDVLSACKPSRSVGSLINLQSKLDFEESLDKVALMAKFPPSREDSPFDHQSSDLWSVRSIVTNWQEALQQVTGSIKDLDAICVEATASEKDGLDNAENIQRCSPTVKITCDRSSVQDTVTRGAQSLIRLGHSAVMVKTVFDALSLGESQNAVDENPMKRAELFDESLAIIGLDFQGFKKLVGITLSTLQEAVDLWSRLESCRPGLVSGLMFDLHHARFSEVSTQIEDSLDRLKNALNRYAKPGETSSDWDKPTTATSVTSRQPGDVDKRAKDVSDSTEGLSDVPPEPPSFEKKAGEFHSKAKSLLKILSILPSWVPDWRNGTLEFEYLLLRNPDNCHYKAGGGKPSFYFPNDESVMIVDGVSLGRVQTMSAAEQKKSTDLKREWDFWVTASHPRHVYGGPKGQQEAFIRTLVAGRNADGSKGTCDLTAQMLEDSFDMGFVGTKKAESETTPTNDMLIGLGSVWLFFKFGVTDQGFMARVPDLTEEGDIIAVFLGAKTPFVLRRYEKLDAYLVVGECYVDGVMEGEVIAELTTGVRCLDELEEFRLV
ncbi:hypothetical protein PV04_06449 [Phialophora macrospora]|uniref:Heterokaryon incompatibility domain-containing protein n=1 Tax=Phialophora macrospora TaxID=1851006 RepID=A0A0D2FGJ4_9EURO|nr:hypothetical protein PV04_06449 [Phialophora macrospora]